MRPLGPDGVVELAVVDRDGLAESRHLGAAVVLDPDGRVIAEYGDVDATVFPRSALKPLQALAMLRTGLRLEGVELALATASHAGTPEHLEVVERMLTAAGLTELALQTPVGWPMDAEAARRSPAPSRIAYTCSGKHAGFLSAAVHLGADTGDYLDPTHPVQRAVLDVVAELTGSPVVLSGIDGCGAPLHAVTVRQLARATSVALTDDPDGRRIAAAVRAHPWALDGPGRANTVAIERTGAFVKGGAEGLIVAVAPDGTTVAAKVLDGAMRATTLVGLTLLARTGAIDGDAASEVVARVTEPVLGGDRVVGAIRLSV